MIKYVRGDATNLDPGAVPIILAHVCNNKGGWGRGFVTAVSKRWKEPEIAYRKMTIRGLGTVEFVDVDQSLCVANMIAQDGYSQQARPALNYPALAVCLSEVARYARIYSADVRMPRIGCGLGGGDWNRVEVIIQRELCDRGVEVTVYDLP